jgi:hypothetical protein
LCLHLFNFPNLPACSGISMKTVLPDEFQHIQSSFVFCYFAGEVAGRSDGQSGTDQPACFTSKSISKIHDNRWWFS